jgi:asparagine synthase (glutamine-hydrolysing)
MTDIFTLLNNIDRFTVKFIKEQLENNILNENKKNRNIFLKNVMIKALFCTNSEDLENLSFINKNDIAIICDGIIYNPFELYESMNENKNDDEKLLPYKDIEIIIDLYIKYGIETTLQLLDGIFSFVLIDYRLNYNENGLDAKIYIARDPFGVKPLYVLKPNKLNNENDEIFAFSSKKETLINYLEPLNNSNTNSYSIEQFIPGTYCVLEHKFKVLSDWSLTKYMIPYHSFEIGNLKNIKTSDKLFKQYLNEAVIKRCNNTNKEPIVVISDDMESNIIAAIANDNTIFKNDKSIQTFSISNDPETIEKIGFITNHIESNNKHIFMDITEIERTYIESEDPSERDESKDEFYNWALLAKRISEYNPNSLVLLTIGMDEFIEENKEKSFLDFRYSLEILMKTFYKEKIVFIDKIFSFYGLEIDFPFLDRNLTQCIVTNNLEDILINPVGIYGGKLLP